MQVLLGRKLEKPCLSQLRFVLGAQLETVYSQCVFLKKRLKKKLTISTILVQARNYGETNEQDKQILLKKISQLLPIAGHILTWLENTTSQMVRAKNV